MKSIISLYEHVRVVVSRSEANFDRACDEAFPRARAQLGLDEDGNFNCVAGAHRSDSSMVIEFKYYERVASMSGHTHNYFFSVYVKKEE